MLSILCVILIIALTIVASYWIIDIQTIVPEKVKEKCELKTEQFMGRNVFIVTPKAKQKSTKKVLYFHGGSYVAEATDLHWDFIEKIVNDTGATVILPDYPLTPKYNYKDVFNMVEPLYKEMINKIDPTDLIIMGDSAGGGLGLALEEKVGKQNLPMPEKTILISPWLDVKLINPQIDEIQKYDKQLNKETLKLAGIAYAGEDGINSYLVNPIEGDLSNLKNVTIFTGTYDILNPDVHVLQEKAKQVGVSIEIREYEQARHVWLIEKNSSQQLEERAYQEILALFGTDPN